MSWHLDYLEKVFGPSRFLIPNVHHADWQRPSYLAVYSFDTSWSLADIAEQILAETKMYVSRHLEILQPANLYGCRAVASAVIVPEVEEQSTQTLDSAKRRNSSFSEESSKRPRLASEISRNQTETSYTTTEPARLSDRRKSGQLEERKRGQRLFGALLGTLSQSSSSTANKRRTDIEKKQQAKLKLQAEEHEEQKKQRLESLMAVRRKEQKKYDKQSVRQQPITQTRPSSS